MNFRPSALSTNDYEDSIGKFDEEETTFYRIEADKEIEEIFSEETRSR